MDKSGNRQPKGGFPKRSSTVKKKITSSHVDLHAKESTNSLLDGGDESSSPVFYNMGDANKDSNVQISLLGGSVVHSPMTNTSPNQSITKQQIMPFSLKQLNHMNTGKKYSMMPGYPNNSPGGGNNNSMSHLVDDNENEGRHRLEKVQHEMDEALEDLQANLSRVLAKQEYD